MPAFALPLLVLVAVAPGVARNREYVTSLIDAEVQAHRVTGDENEALGWLASHGEGVVLADPYLSAVIPGFTGRPVWVGHPSWTPDYARRAAAVDDVLHGGDDPGSVEPVLGAEATTLVLRCEEGRTLPAALQQQVTRTTSFGCVQVLELDRSRADR